MIGGGEGRDGPVIGGGDGRDGPVIGGGDVATGPAFSLWIVARQSVVTGRLGLSTW